jgi:hypothetical protein
MLEEFAQYAYIQVGFEWKCRIFRDFLGSFGAEISECKANSHLSI